MPLDPLFADRLHFLSEPGAGWDSPGMAEFHKDTAEYVSPELTIEDREIPGPQGRFQFAFTPLRSSMAAARWFGSTEAHSSLATST